MKLWNLCGIVRCGIPESKKKSKFIFVMKPRNIQRKTMEEFINCLLTIFCCRTKPQTEVGPVSMAQVAGGGPVDGPSSAPAPPAPAPPPPAAPPAPAPAPAPPVPAAPPKLSYDEVCQWSKGLRNLLSTQEGIDCFGAFMRRDVNERLEYLECYLELKNFKDLTKVEDIERVAITLQSRYFNIPELAFSKRTKERLLERLESKEWTKYFFDEARVEVFEIMKNSTFVKFLSSEEYKQKRDELFRFWSELLSMCFFYRISCLDSMNTYFNTTPSTMAFLRWKVNRKQCWFSRKNIIFRSNPLYKKNPSSQHANLPFERLQLQRRSCFRNDRERILHNRQSEC